MNRPVRPSDAASLVLLRRAGDGSVEILMGRREPRHKFIPDRFVFPGGRLDTGDAALPLASPLRPEVTATLCRHTGARKATALGVAAVRETFEETGLVVGDIDADGLKPDLARLDIVARAITPPQSPIRFHARFFAVDGGTLKGELRGNGELLDLHWVELRRALQLPIIDVTEFVIEEMLRRLAEGPPPGLPLFSYRHGKPIIRYQ